MILNHFALTLPNGTKKGPGHLREHLVKYNETVVGEEWIDMRYKKISLEAYKYYDLVWSDCATFKPKEGARTTTSIKRFWTASQLSVIADACACIRCTTGFQNLSGEPSRQEDCLL
jgi:hypothetical protein